MKDGRIVEVEVVVGGRGSRVRFERYLPLHDAVLKRHRVAFLGRPSNLENDPKAIGFSQIETRNFRIEECGCRQ